MFSNEKLSATKPGSFCGKKSDKILSIIIPVHNRENELIDLVSSIPEREDIEIIVIDDHSDPPRKPVNHPCVRFFLLPPGMRYAGTARNFGLEKAVGKWVLFADSDDVFFRDSLGKAIERIERTEADIIFCPVQSFRAGGLKGKRHKKINRLLYDARSGDRQALIKWYPPWGKFYKRSFLDLSQIRFDTGKVSNDVMFSAKSFLAANKVGFVEEVFYSVREGNQSLTQSKSSEDISHRLDVLFQFNLLLDLSNLRYYHVPIFAQLRFIVFRNPVCAVHMITRSIKHRHPLFFTKRTLFELWLMAFNTRHAGD